MTNSRKRIFITGIAGFIGFHLAQKLARHHQVFGCDTFTSYYDPALKQARAKLLQEDKVEISICDICNQEQIEALIEKHNITHFVHLAAQAGVRHSLTHPHDYQKTNSNGFFHILEALRKFPSIKLIFASSSSVYGSNKKIPFSEEDPTDHPVNFYGATKKSNELMAYSYHHLYRIPTIGLRFFTVYGPWGRPDMAYFSFAKAIKENRSIQLFNQGNMQRDFTYIDDVIAGISTALDYPAEFEIFNLGNHRPEPLEKMIHLIEVFMQKKAIVEKLPMPSGEIPITFAQISKAQKHLQFFPKTSFEMGMKKFLEWFATYS